MSYNTIAQLFLDSCAKYPDNKVYHDKVDGQWQALTYSDVLATVENFAYGLASLGIEQGDKVAILSNNNSKWAMADFAIICLGGVTVTVYPTLVATQIEYIIDNSDTKLIITEDDSQTEKIMDFMAHSPTLDKIVSIKESEKYSDRVQTFDAVAAAGEKHKAGAGFYFLERANAIQPGDLLTLIYTSGTTGNPKGVMLTHDNLVSNVKASLKATHVDESDIRLSFLPLSHVFERMVGHFTGFTVGGQGWFAESIDKVAENMGEVRPTIMASVPRLYEKIYNRIIENVNTYPALRKKIFWWAIGVGKKAIPLKQKGKSPTGWLGFRHAVADKLVFSKLKERIGGRLRFFMSGGAPLPKEIGEFFLAADIKILEGYGLTETSPVITTNREHSFKFGTVGVPIDGVEVKIAEDGEILCKGPNVMKGYYKNDEATAEAIDGDNWFYTGDIGEFDEDGFLKITDRKKSLIVTSGGKNIAPAPLENALLTSAFIEQCLVVGDRRNFISALVVPAFDALKTWCTDKDIETTDMDTILAHTDVQAHYQQIIDKAMEGFSRFEQVKKCALVNREWTIEDNELTPTLKVKRKVVTSHFDSLIDSIYES